LHLDRGKLQLYRAIIPLRKAASRSAELAAKAGKKQEEQRKHLQAFVDRFRAKATKARQAQSRNEAAGKMQEVVAIVDEEVLPIHLPSPQKPLSPPIIALETPASL